MGQLVACVPVMQRAWVQSPVGTSFLGEIFFRGFSSLIRQMSWSFRPPRSLNIIWPSLSSIIIHYGHQWPEMLMRPKTSNIHTTRKIITERGGSVVTHETRILEVPGSNPGVDQPDWGFFVVFLNHLGYAGFYFHYHDPFDHYSSNSYIIKLIQWT